MWVQIGAFPCICGTTVPAPLMIDDGPLGEDYL